MLVLVFVLILTLTLTLILILTLMMAGDSWLAFVPQNGDLGTILLDSERLDTQGRSGRSIPFFSRYVRFTHCQFHFQIIVQRVCVCLCLCV